MLILESTNSNDPARIDHTFDNKKEDDQLQKDTHARIGTCSICLLSLDFCNVDEGSASNEFTECKFNNFWLFLVNHRI